MKGYIKNSFILTFAAAALVNSGCSAVATQKEEGKTYVATEESLKQYQVPEWYQDAKLGYWVHWGLYSVPAYAGDHAAEWYGRWMYAVDDGSGKDWGEGFERRGLKTARHHRETYGDPDKFNYTDFIPMWKAEKFNAEEWADLFTEGGAKFFTMMAMHHDNYPLWDSKTTSPNSVNSGPHRDFVAEMEKAIRKRGLHFGVSNHSAWNSRFFEFKHKNGFEGDKSPLYGTKDVDANDEARWWSRTTELVEKYHPDLVWFDWCWNKYPYTRQTRMNFTSWYYNQANYWGKSTAQSPEVVVAYKERGKLPDGSAVLDVERGGMTGIYPYVWMNDTSLGIHSWSYAADEIYRSSNQVVDMLLDIISKNGVLLLNIGPKADGTIPEQAQNSIKSIGKWLAKNGEGVYATRPWLVFGEGPTQPNQSMGGDEVEYTNNDVRFTRSKDNTALYVHVLGYNPMLNVKTLSKANIDLSSLKGITNLSTGEKVEYNQTTEGLSMTMPASVDKEDAAYSFKLTFTGQIPALKK